MTSAEGGAGRGPRGGPADLQPAPHTATVITAGDAMTSVRVTAEGGELTAVITGDGVLTAVITGDAADGLALSPGAPVVVLIKATAVSLATA
ncbi:TOBE domain-containing protein [Streptomyces sp. NPDC096046]|uniref:TOBE domain-containing protein n=1 Tax=Streptomyces sp. NPDC096046 TaxID=3155542 RepID=UPI00333495F7